MGFSSDNGKYENGATTIGRKIMRKGRLIALGIAADTGHVAKARSSMSEQPGPQGTPKRTLK